MIPLRQSAEEFAPYMLDVFRLFGRITLRRMFSGYGIFHNGLMFGLLSQGILYLKADARNAGDFQKHGLKQFEYVRQGKPIGLSYYQAPDTVLEDQHEAAQWAHRSFEAALRADMSKSGSE